MTGGARQIGLHIHSGSPTGVTWAPLLFLPDTNDAPTSAGGTGILGAEFNPRSVTVGAFLVRCEEVDLFPAVTDLAGGAWIELAERVFPCPFAKGAPDLFRVSQVLNPL